MRLRHSSDSRSVPGVALIVPNDVDSLCCGTPWTSKDMRSGHAALEARVQTSLLRATGGGKLPVVMDAASCTHGMIDIAGEIGIEVIDAVTFVAKHMLHALPAGTKVDSLTLHPTCSTTHLGIQPDLEKVAAAAAAVVRVPES